MSISKEFKIGVVVVIAAGCFLFGFNFLKGRNYFSNQRTFYAVYHDIDGLVEGNPIVINGYKVGIVGGIKLSTDSSRSVIVSLLLDNEANIPVNSVAKVVSSDLLGSKAVKLELGTGIIYAVSGDTLTSDQEENLKASVNKVIAPLQRKAASLLSSIDSVMVVVQLVFNEKARQSLAQSFENINLALGSLQTTSYRLDTLVEKEQKKISSILSKVNKISTTLADNSDDLSNMIGNFSAISDSLAKSNLTSAINNADAALTQFSGIMTKVNEGKGSLGLLINNESLYDNLKKSSDDLDLLLIDLKLHPKRYVHFSLFGGKKKYRPLTVSPLSIDTTSTDSIP